MILFINEITKYYLILLQNMYNVFISVILIYSQNVHTPHSNSLSILWKPQVSFPFLGTFLLYAQHTSLLLLLSFFPNIGYCSRIISIEFKWKLLQWIKLAPFGHWKLHTWEKFCTIFSTKRINKSKNCQMK